MSKKLLYASSIRQGGTLHTDLLEGTAQLALAVASTLGPRGRNVIIDRAGETPLITKDGVTVANNIQITNPVHNAAAKLIQRVARATVNEAGDGTTTATVLAYRIFEAGLELVESGSSPILLQRSITAAVELLSSIIRGTAVQPNDDQITQVANISTNGNGLIASMIGEAMARVGRDGLITFDDSKDHRTSIEMREGFQFESGWTNPAFVTNERSGTAILDNPYIFFTERILSQGVTQVSTLHDLGPLMGYAAGLNFRGNAQDREPRPLLIIADDVVGDAMSSLVVNHQKQNIKVCVVRAPSVGEYRRQILADMALATNGKVLTMDSGTAVSRWVTSGEGRSMEYDGSRLGTCARAVISNGRTILEGCPGDPQDPGLVKDYAQNLRQQAAQMTDPESREKMLQRAARLVGEVATILVGAATEPEARALRDSVEDAVLAVRAALAEGIVPGGGLCLFGLARVLRNTAGELNEGETRDGALLVAECLEAPLRQIASNAGMNPGEVADRVDVANEAAPEHNFTIGFNAATGRYEDLVAAGIVDPAKVVRVAFEKAASIAALMLTSSCLIYFDPDAVRAPASPIPGQVQARV